MIKRQKRGVTERSGELMSLGRSSFVSQRGMAALLKSVKEEGCPEHFSRGAQYKARKSECYTNTRYGTLVESRKLTVVQDSGNDKGKESQISVGFANPCALLHEHCRRSKDFSKIVQEALARHPCSPSTPWNIIFYQDGVDPSDGLAKHHSRKSSVFYFSFLEFGQRALAHEEVWGTLCIMREAWARKLKDGIAELTNYCMQAFFDAQHDIRRAGVQVTLNDGSHHVIFADIGVILADAVAFKDMCSCKGHGGTKPCLLCMNCTNHKPPGGARPVHETSTYCVPMCETNFDRFIKYDADDPTKSIRSTVLKLHGYKATLSAQEFEEKEQLMGWVYCQSSIVCNDRLRLALEKLIMYDWAHVYVCDGLLEDELGQCMSAFRNARDRDTTYAELGRYAAGCTFPGKRSVGHLFTEQKAANNYKKHGFSSTGSELLTLVPVLVRYFSQVVMRRGRMLDHVRSILACLFSVQLLMATRLCIVSPDKLAHSIRTHLELYAAVYGVEEMRPKHHYALHLPDMLKRFGVILTTFVNERKHRIVKKYTHNRNSLVAFDLCALEDVTVHQLWELSLPFFNMYDTAKPRGRVFHALRELWPGVPDEAFSLHTSLKLHGGSAATNDVVSFEHNGVMEVGLLRLAVGVQVGNEASMFAIMSKWVAMDASADGSLQNYRVEDDIVCVSVASLDTIFTHRMSDAGDTCAVFVPWELRP